MVLCYWLTLVSWTSEKKDTPELTCLTVQLNDDLAQITSTFCVTNLLSGAARAILRSRCRSLARSFRNSSLSCTSSSLSADIHKAAMQNDTSLSGTELSQHSVAFENCTWQLRLPMTTCEMLISACDSDSWGSCDSDSWGSCDSDSWGWQWQAVKCSSQSVTVEAPVTVTVEADTDNLWNAHHSLWQWQLRILWQWQLRLAITTCEMSVTVTVKCNKDSKQLTDIINN